MRTRRVVASAVAIAALSGCAAPPSASPTDAASSTCPDGWRNAVAFSTENGTASEIVFLDESGVAGRRRLDWIGLAASPTDGAVRASDGAWWLISNGSTQRDRTALLRMDPRSCAFAAVRATEPNIRAIAPVSDGIISVNGLNGFGEVRRRDLAGDVVAETKFEGVDFVALAVAPDGATLYACGSTMGQPTDVGVVYALDARSLRLKGKAELGEGVTPSTQVKIVGDRLIIPTPTGAGDQESDRIASVDLQNLRVAWSSTGSVSPFLLASVGARTYVGHTFMNPGFRAMSDYRYVTEYVADGQGAPPHAVNGPILALRGQGQSLLVLSGDPGQSIRLVTYSTPGLTLQRTQDLAAPELGGNAYIAGLIVVDQ